MRRTRLNIYVDDSITRKQVRTAAAKQDVSVSEYCLQAIREKLTQEDHLSSAETRLSAAVKKARQFQKHAFAGGRFSISSAALIAEARRTRK